MNRSSSRRTPIFVLLILATTLHASAEESRLELRAEPSCPERPLTARQLTECLSEGVTVRHAGAEGLAVRFEIAVLHQGRVQHVLASEAFETSPKRWFALRGIDLPDSLEIPGGDMFIPGGDMFIPGGDMFVEDEEDYRRTLGAYAEEYAIGEQPVLVIVARPHAETLLATLGFSATVIRLTIA